VTSKGPPFSFGKACHWRLRTPADACCRCACSRAACLAPCTETRSRFPRRARQPLYGELCEVRQAALEVVAPVLVRVLFALATWREFARHHLLERRIQACVAASAVSVEPKAKLPGTFGTKCLMRRSIDPSTRVAAELAPKKRLLRCLSIS